MRLEPLDNSFLFSFFVDHAAGRFIERNSGQIILTNQELDTQGSRPRWGKVEAIGPKVKDFNVGDIVLIEALQWTKEFSVDGKSFWKSDDTKVMALGADESVTYTY